LFVDDLLGVPRGRRRLVRHASVMPDPRKKYKSNHVEYVI
jgi:hypothetical protein